MMLLIERVITETKGKAVKHGGGGGGGVAPFQRGMLQLVSCHLQVVYHGEVKRRMLHVLGYFYCRDL